MKHCLFFKKLTIFLFFLNFNYSFGQDFNDTLKLSSSKAKEFLIHKIKVDSCSPEVIIFLPWFQKQSGIELMPENKLSEFLELKKKQEPVYQLYGRFMGPISQKPDFQSSLDSYTLECLYWDFEKKDIRPMIKQMTIDSRTKKGYDLTHLILRWYILKAQNCPYAHPELISSLYEDWKNELPKIKSPDLLAEYLAMASFTGWQIPELEIRRLIQMQNKDGGFPWEKPGIQSEPHSTFLALWAITTYLNPKNYYFHFSKK